MTAQKKRRLMTPARVVAVLLLLAAGAGGWVWFKKLPLRTTAETRAIYPVRRGDMVISITEGGTLEAVRQITVVNDVQGTRRINSIVPEGSNVQKGDLLVELSAEDLDEKITQQEITNQQALSSVSQAESDLALQRSKTASNIRDAEQKVDFAAIDLEKYKNGDWPQDLKKAESDITIAEAELQRAQDRLQWTEKLEAKGYATRSELEADRLTVKRNELDLEQARERLRLMRKYDYPVQTRKLEAALQSATEELERVRAQSEATLANAETNLEAKQAQLKLQEDRLKEYREQRDKCRLFAPQTGLVVYASSVNRRYGGEQIEEGAQVRHRQELIMLPDTSAMKVTVKIHESRINQVSIGQRAYVVIDALPEARYPARVGRIGVLPDAQNRWLNPDLKVYSTDIILDEQLADHIKPGLSARCEIIIARLENVISVPIQTVVTEAGQQVCYVVDGETSHAQPVQVGMFNENRIEIKDGLADGMRILLNPEIRGDKQSLGVGVVESESLTAGDAEPKPEAVRKTGVEAEAEAEAKPAGESPQAAGGGDRPHRRPPPRG